MAADLQLGIIHIIESIAGGFAARTGRQLFEIVEPLAAQMKPRALETRYWFTPTEAEFMDCLAGIADDTRSRRLAPIIHIECHGLEDRTGLQLASGENVLWPELQGPMIQINAECGLNLVLVIAACLGVWAMQVEQMVEPCPAFGIIGPDRVVGGGEILDAHAAFYKTLLTKLNVNHAVQAMNVALGAADEPFKELTALTLFRLVMRGYFKDQLSDERLTVRLDRLVDSAQTQGTPAEQLPHFRKFMEQLLKNRPAIFEWVKRDFFMLDRWPQNAARFLVRLEDVT